ncbi:MAG: hypothetical protein VCD31_18915, partial [Alphaproteobacteria bacterium]
RVLFRSRCSERAVWRLGTRGWFELFGTLRTAGYVIRWGTMASGRDKGGPEDFSDLIPTEVNGVVDGINRTADWSEMDKTAGSADGINRTADWSEVD